MEDDDLIPLSALQHYLYCPRQCALIHVERLWVENCQTAEGRLRFYYLGRNWQHRVEHVGAKVVLDLNGPLIL